jgi:hypothetical protein
MNIRSRLISFLIVLFLGLCVSAPAALAKDDGTPEGVVKAFAHQYFMLDEKMAGHMSREALYTEHDVNRVDLLFRVKEQEAFKRGLELNYLRMRPILMKTQVVSEDDDSAVIEFSAVMVRNINPIYRMVGYVFGMMKEHDFETTVTVIKEDGIWKVGPGGFAFPA